MRTLRRVNSLKRRSARSSKNFRAKTCWFFIIRNRLIVCVRFFFSVTTHFWLTSFSARRCSCTQGTWHRLGLYSRLWNLGLWLWHFLACWRRWVFELGNRRVFFWATNCCRFHKMLTKAIKNMNKYGVASGKLHITYQFYRLFLLFWYFFGTLNRSEYVTGSWLVISAVRRKLERGELVTR